MSAQTHSNLVMATRSVLPDNILTSSGLSTAKQYFASKRTIIPEAAPFDAVWVIDIFGTTSSALSLAPTIALAVEIDRSIVIPTAANFSFLANISGLKWHIHAMLTRSDGALMVNGYVGMQTTLTGAYVTSPLKSTGVYSGINWGVTHNVEFSLAYTAIGAGNTTTLEQMAVFEHRTQ